MPEVMVPGWKCTRCFHKWVSNGKTESKPIVCPKCKNPYWDKPRLE